MKRHWVMKGRWTTALRRTALAATALALTGCYESSDVTVHEPGVYKGSADSHDQAAASQRADTLAKRFQMVQTDR